MSRYQLDIPIPDAAASPMVISDGAALLAATPGLTLISTGDPWMGATGSYLPAVVDSELGGPVVAQLAKTAVGAAWGTIAGAVRVARMAVAEAGAGFPDTREEVVKPAATAAGAAVGGLAAAAVEAAAAAAAGAAKAFGIGKILIIVAAAGVVAYFALRSAK